MTSLRAAAATDAGRVRPTNQDLALVDGDLLVVADGMGGHAGGEVAARTAVEALRRGFSADETPDGLLEAAQGANAAVYAQAGRQRELHGMGTTLTAAALVRSVEPNEIALVNVGDSRAYLFQDGELTRLTEDHSLVAEMVKRGELTPAEAAVHPHRHILTRALGIDPEVEIDSWMLSPGAGARLLLCSDGLTNECDEDEIAQVLGSERDPAGAARELVRRALAHGGNDNITVVVADIEDSPPAGGAVPVQLPEAVTQPPPTAAGPVVREGGQAGDGADARSGDPETAATAVVRAAPPDEPLTVATAAVTPRRSRRRVLAVGPSSFGAPAAYREAPGRDRIFTVRVAIYVTLLVATLAGAAGFVVWFNNATYFVGLDHGRVAIFEGRPSGLLFFRPKLLQLSDVAESSVLEANLPLLRQGLLEPSFAAAENAVNAIADEKSVLGLSAPAKRTVPPSSSGATTTSSLPAAAPSSLPPTSTTPAARPATTTTAPAPARTTTTTAPTTTLAPTTTAPATTLAPTTTAPATAAVAP